MSIGKQKIQEVMEKAEDNIIGLIEQSFKDSTAHQTLELTLRRLIRKALVKAIKDSLGGYIT